MKYTKQILGALALLLATVTAAADSWVLAPVNVIDVTTGEVTTNQAIHVSGERILSIRNARDLPADLRIFDGQNGWVIPGLAEMHAHVPSTSRGQQAVQDVLDAFLVHGVTTIRGMLGEPGHLALRDRLASGEVLGPRLITSGPSFNGNSVSSPDQGAARVREQKDAGYDFLKIHPGLERDEFIAIANTANELDIPFAGHVSYQTGLKTALDHGQATIDHLDAYAEDLLPASSELLGEAPQWFGLNLASDLDPSRAPALARATADAGVWVVPTQSLFETTTGTESLESLGSRPGMDLLSPALAERWAASVENIRSQSDAANRARFLQARRTLIKALQDAGAGMLLGADAPQIMNVPGISTHQEMAYLVDAGLTPLQALQAGTLNPAKFFGFEDQGQVQPGFAADLVLLGANPLESITNSTNILGVVRAGHWLDRENLDERLATIRQRGLD